jgi:2-polyprenyl-3-methyl-5-hydroxy-6-metoxy-1,4-benzoquinol methylase
MTATFSPEKLDQVLGKVISDFGGTYHASLVVIGDKLGLYKGLAADGPLTPAALATRTGTAERYVREWLNANAAGGYIDYDPATGRYSMSPEQAMILADEQSPVYFAGGFQAATAATQIVPKLTEAFRTGAGVGWHEHDHGVFHGVARFYRSGYEAYLVQSWIPALDGVEAKLRAGARVADVGCGHGESTVIMALAYPHATFVGYDFHDASIEAARQRAEEAGVANRVRFEVAAAKDYAGRGFDLVTTFDCLHDLGDPVGAAAHIRQSLAPDGTWLIVEPFAGDRVEDNLHPLGRAYYAASTLICTPTSLDQEVGLALGAQAGEARLREVIAQGGSSRIRVAAQTPVNLILEARP